jgi:hypothetical protein
MPVGNTMANGYWTARATRRQINFIPGSNITINVDDDPTLNTANITITSTASGGDPSFAFSQANTAYNRANSANVDAVAAFLKGNTAHAGANTTWTYAANTVMLAANSAYAYANGVNTNTFTSLATAIAAYAQANTTWTYAANTVMLAANSAYVKANAANIIADAAFAYSNGVNTNTFTTLAASVAAFLKGNTAHAGANTTWTYAANDVMRTANSAFAAGNTTYTYAANTVMLAANAAFAMANAANLMPVGNTMSKSYYTVRATRRKLNFIPGSNITINVDDDPTLNTANITITSTASGPGGGGAAVSAVPPGSPTANDLWWSSETGKLYVYYNDGTSSQWVDASPGEVIANGAAEIAIAAYVKANAANIIADSTYTYAANTVMLAANAAFAKANTTNVRSTTPLNITVSSTEPTGNSIGDIWIDIS